MRTTRVVLGLLPIVLAALALPVATAGHPPHTIQCALRYEQGILAASARDGDDNVVWWLAWDEAWTTGNATEQGVYDASKEALTPFGYHGWGQFVEDRGHGATSPPKAFAYGAAVPASAKVAHAAGQSFTVWVVCTATTLF